MPVQTLGLFSRIFNWVFDKLFSPVLKWLGEILASIFEFIFETILQPFLENVFGVLWKAIAAPILNFFYRGVYAIYSGLLWILDLVQQGFDILIGLQNISYYDEASGEVMETTLLNYIIFDDGIRSVLIAVTMIAMILCIAFSIYSVMRSTLDFDFENKRPVGKVLTMTAKSMLTFLMIPLIVWVGLNLASSALVATANALSGSNASISDTILAITSMNAHRTGEPFSFNTSPWSGLMDGTYNAVSFGIAINISEIDYFVGFTSSIFCMVIMLMCLFTFIRRIYDIVVLYIVSPYFASTMVLDDGQKFNSWRDTFIAKVLIGFGSAIGMRLFLMLIPIIMGDEIQFFDNVLMDATAGYLLKLIFVIGGMYSVYKSSSLLTSIVNSRVGAEEAMSNSRMMHGMAFAGHKLGGAAVGGIKQLSNSLANRKNSLPSTGNKQPIPAGPPSASLTTGFRIDGTKGATAEQSKEWQNALGVFDAGKDHSQTKNMHIRDVEDMSESLHNLFGDDIVRGNDVEDMSKELGDLFEEKPELDLGSFIKDNYERPQKQETGKLIGDLSSFIKEDYVAAPEPKASVGSIAGDLDRFIKGGATGTEPQTSSASITGDLSSFIKEDYSVGASANSSISVGSKSFSIPDGYVAMPKIVPKAKAEARVQQMKSTGGAQFGSYYDTISSGIKSGSYSAPQLTSSVSQISGVSSVDGKQLHVPDGYTVIPEIMKTNDAVVAASSIKGGRNQEFYSAYASAITQHQAAPVAQLAVKRPTSADIADLESMIGD